MQKVQLVAGVLISAFVAGVPAQDDTRQVLIENRGGLDADALEDLRDAVDAEQTRIILEGEAEIWTLRRSEENDFMRRLGRLPRPIQPEVEPLDADYRNLLVKPAPDVSLTRRQAELVSAMRQHSDGGKVTILTLSPMPLVEYSLERGFDLQDGFRAAGSIQIPVSEDEFIIGIRDQTRAMPEGMLWYGHPEAGQGSIMLIRDGGSINGTIRTSDRVISIQPIGSGLHGITETKVRNLPPDHDPEYEEEEIIEEDDESMDMPFSPPMTQTERVEIDILVAYTDKVARQYVSIEKDLVNLALQNASQSLKLSGLPNLQLNVVHIHRTNYADNGSLKNHRDAFASFGDGIMDEIHGLRDQYKADIGILFVASGKGCGLAEVHATSATAFAVVRHDCERLNFTFAHEIGHLFGARHDVYKDRKSRPYPFGHGYVFRQDWRTIMAYPDACNWECNRIEYWSGPGIHYQGLPTGTARYEHDLLVLRVEAKRVAAFR